MRCENRLKFAIRCIDGAATKSGNNRVGPLLCNSTGTGETGTGWVAAFTVKTIAWKSARYTRKDGDIIYTNFTLCVMIQ